MRALWQIIKSPSSFKNYKIASVKLRNLGIASPFLESEEAIFEYIFAIPKFMRGGLAWYGLREKDLQKLVGQPAFFMFSVG